MPLPPRADFRELRIFLDLDAPAVVVHQVPVERVHLVQRHGVEQLLDLGLGEEVAAHVEHQPAPAEARIILDRNAGHAPLDAGDLLPLLDLRRQELPERLDALEHARRRRALDGDFFRCHFQRVGFRPTGGQRRVDGKRHFGARRDRNRPGHRP